MIRSPLPPLLPPPRTVLSIAGHDPSSGAGITADLQTFAAHGFFGTSAITALTAQSSLGVQAVTPVAPRLLDETLALLCADLPPAGIKAGMLGSIEIVAVVSGFLAAFGANHPSVPIVLDPVLRSSSGAALLAPEALGILTHRLLPAVHWITPNWTELAALSGQPVASLAAAEAAMHLLGHLHPHLHIVATGGDHDPPTDLLRLPSGELHRLPGERIPTTSTHGTGCAFSSALLCRLLRGDDPLDAGIRAKYFVAGALRHAPGLGHGRGPLDLLWQLRRS